VKNINKQNLYLPGFLKRWLLKICPFFTGTTPKPRFYDSEQPRNHTEEKREGRGERGKDKGLLALIIFILPTLKKKGLLTLIIFILATLDQAVPFSKIQVDIHSFI